MKRTLPNDIMDKIKKINHIVEQSKILQSQIEKNVKQFEKEYNTIVLPEIKDSNIIIHLAINVGNIKPD